MNRRSNLSISSNYDNIILLIIVLISLALVSTLIFLPGARAFFCNDKAWELTIQFLYIAVIGSSVGFAYKRWESARSEEKLREEEERELRSLKRAALEEFYKSFNDIHFAYKKIRRTLRANCIIVDEKRCIRKQSFEDIMSLLEDCQLRAENIRRDTEIKKDLFDECHDNMISNIIIIEENLRGLLKQYESSGTHRNGIGPNDMVELGEKIAIFMGSSKNERNKKLFDAADEMRKCLIMLIERSLPNKYF